MDLNALNSRISVLNAESKRLNDARQVSIGKRETLQNQLNASLRQYKEKYGVDLTVETLNDEIKKISSQKLEEVNKIESALGLIREGRIQEANVLLGVETHSAVSEISDVNSANADSSTSGVLPDVGNAMQKAMSEVFTPSNAGVANVEQQSLPAQPVQVTESLSTQSVQVAESLSTQSVQVAESLPAQPVQVTEPLPAQPVQPSQPVMPDLNFSSMMAPPADDMPAPPNIGLMASKSNLSGVKSFGAILNDTEFKPN